jgi:hypothetical protein
MWWRKKKEDAKTATVAGQEALIVADAISLRGATTTCSPKAMIGTIEIPIEHVDRNGPGKFVCSACSMTFPLAALHVVPA